MRKFRLKEVKLTQDIIVSKAYGVEKNKSI